MAGDFPLDRVERLLDVVEDVVGVFQAHREAQRTIADPVLGALFRAVDRMRHAGRVLNQCLGIAETDGADHSKGSRVRRPG